MSSSIPSGESENIQPGESRVFTSIFTQSGDLTVSGTATVTDIAEPIFGKSRADGEKNLIVRAEGEID